MLCSEKKSLADELIEILATKGHCTAYELRDEVLERSRSFTIQAVYQELRKLYGQGVVVKVKDTYMLRLSWVEKFLMLGEQLNNNYVEHSPYEHMIPEEGKTLEFKIRSLQRTARVLIRLLSTILHNNPNAIIYQHLQHVWFHLAYEDETRYIEILKNGGHQYNMCTVYNTFLDRMYKRTFPDMPGRVINGDTPLSEKKSYTTVVGDYVMRLYIEQRLKRDLSDLFHTTENASDISPGLITELMTRMSTIRITLERNEAKAKKLMQKMAEFFGDA